MCQTIVTSPVHYSSHTFSPTGQSLRPSSGCFVRLENYLSLHKSLWRPTSKLTTSGKVLLEKITGPQLVKKFPAYYGTRRFITTFTRARLLSLFWARSIQSMPPHSTSWISILMLSWFFQVVSFPQVSPPKPCMHLSPLSHTCYMPRPSNSSWSDRRNNIWWRVQMVNFLVKRKPILSGVDLVPSICVTNFRSAHTHTHTHTHTLHEIRLLIQNRG